MKVYQTLAEVPQSTRNRLAYIDYLLYFKGEANRADIFERFNIVPNQVTKDFVYYKTLAPDNIDYDDKLRIHVRNEKFSPFFPYDTPKLLASIAQGFGDGVDDVWKETLPALELQSFSRPKEEVIAAVTRAIHKQSPLHVRYISLSSGETERTIVPHALVNNGLRWHVRAFDRKHQAFRDFVLTRISAATVEFDHLSRYECSKQQPLNPAESAAEDTAWQETIELVLAPHPSVKYPQAVELDYGMEKGEKRIKLRKAVAPYLLRLWNVDCTAKGTLEGNEFQLWLKNSKKVSKEIEMGIVAG